MAIPCLSHFLTLMWQITARDACAELRYPRTSQTWANPTYSYTLHKRRRKQTKTGSRHKTHHNRLFKYELNENRTSLVNPKLLLDLPSTPGAWHNGGAITIGSDNYIYIPIGDVNASYGVGPETMAQNHENGTKPDGRAGILRISQAGRSSNPYLVMNIPLACIMPTA